MRLYYKVREDVESVQYCDIMSLYPYICKYLKFPIGHPIIHVGDACADIEACLKMEDPMKCKIVPPDDLYHPVLPYRCDKKLLFCLCRTCVLEQRYERMSTSRRCRNMPGRHVGHRRGAIGCGQRIHNFGNFGSVRIQSRVTMPKRVKAASSQTTSTLF